jgi:GNAT superfamily N-acetyltransferase
MAAGACIGGSEAPIAIGAAAKTKRRYARSSRVVSPGLVAFHGELAVGWCQLTPRDALPWLDHMWWFQRVDDKPVWSISCFFVRRGYRRQGVMAQLIFAAVKAAKLAKASALEAYPIDTSVPNSTSNTFTGTSSTFARAGFKEVARRAAARPIMRHDLKTTRR